MNADFIGMQEQDDVVPPPTDSFAEPAGTESFFAANAGGRNAGARDGEQPAQVSLAGQPKELGYLLLTAGAIGFVLPGPGTPALLAGGLILWPEGFGKVQGWLQKRFPVVHRTGMSQLGRYISDLEARYPGTTRGFGDSVAEGEQPGAPESST